MKSSPHILLAAAGKVWARREGILVAVLLMASGLTAVPAAVFDVNIQPAQFTLYTDPYNGNQIKLGGFSGLYPVPGKPDSFYTITDRGPAPDRSPPRSGH